MKRILLLLTFTIISLSGFGQNIKTSASLGANIFGGNYNAYIVNTQVTLSQDSTKVSWTVSPNFTFGQVDKSGSGNYVTNQREAYITGNLSHKFNNQRILGTIEAENSFLKKIDFRGSLGVGYGYDLIRNKKITLLLSEAILAESYNSDVNISRNAFSMRLSTRLKFEYIGKMKFTSITLFQPSIYTSPQVSISDNINLRSINSIELPIVKKLSIGLINNINVSTYSSFINPLVKPIDWNLLFAIKYRNL